MRVVHPDAGAAAILDPARHPDSPGLSILMVEDNVQVVHSLRKGLEADGFSVEAVGTIAAARAACGRRRYDALTLDLTLPNGDGMMVVDRVVPLAPGTPFLVVTAHNDDALAITAITRGADDVLYKGMPNLRQELGLRIRFAIYRRQRERGTVQAVDADAEMKLYQRRAADRKRRDLNQFGWAMYGLAFIVLIANVGADLAARQRPSFSLTTAAIIFSLATLAIATTQGVDVDRVVTALARLRGGQRRGDPPAGR